MPLPTVEAYCLLTLNLVTGNNVFLVPSVKMLACSFLHENGSNGIVRVTCCAGR
jgi:hypothetical protein